MGVFLTILACPLLANRQALIELILGQCFVCGDPLAASILSAQRLLLNFGNRVDWHKEASATHLPFTEETEMTDELIQGDDAWFDIGGEG